MAPPPLPHFDAAMTNLSYTLFDTALGFCGVVWNERAIAGIQLPGSDAHATRARLLKRFPEAVESQPPPVVADAIARMTALLDGEKASLNGIAIDIAHLPAFNRKVYAVACMIPPGATMTYGEIATRLGDPKAARAVGQALGENPVPLIVPCHRVLAANGKTGGFSASGGVVTKLKLLTIEGAQPGGPTLFENLPLAAGPRRSV